MSDAPRRAPDRALDTLIRAAFEAGADLIESTGTSLPPLAPESWPSLPGYTVLGEVARGGVGVVLRARDDRLGRDVAVKVLNERYDVRSPMVARFLEEARIAGQLQHPGIVPIHELGRDRAGRPYFTMKLVKGETLATLLARRKSPGEDLTRYLRIFEKVCQTVAYAHARGVIHRDLKPANIMVGAFGEVQVMDWGLAKVLGQREGEGECTVIRTAEAGRARSQAGSVLGTPAYMPPEQARGELHRVDARSDVFSLGAILLEILTGEPPYLGQTALTVQDRARRAELGPALARLSRAACDRELKGLARACLQPDPKRRPADAGVLAQRLTAYLESVADRARKAQLQAARAEARVQAERRARRMTLVAALAVVLLLVGGGTAALAWQQAEQTRRLRRTGELSAAEAELSERWREARSGDGLSPARWAAAEAAARRAAALASAPEIPAPRRARVQGTVERVLAEARAAAARRAEKERRLRFLRRLEEIALLPDPFDLEEKDREYEAAFRAFGLDLRRLSPGAATATIRASPLRGRIIAALDDWAVARRELKREWRSLVLLAQAADEHALRRRLRSAALQADVAALRRAAAELDVARALPETLHFLGRALVAAGRRDAAIRLFRRAQPHHVDDFWINLHLAHWLYHAEPAPGREAVRYSYAALALRPQAAWAWFYHGNILSKGGEEKGALAAYRRVIALDPKNSLAYVNLGRSLRALGRHEEAERATRKALELNPRDAWAWVDLARTHRRRGRLDRALEAARRALRLKPSLGEAAYELARIHQRCGNPREALRAVEEGLRRSADYAPLHRLKGELLLRLGRTQEAVKALQRAHGLSPSCPVAARELARAYLAAGAPAKAVPLLRELVRSGRARLRDRLALGRALTEAGWPEEARRALEALVRKDPNYAPGWLALGRVRRDQGDLEGAARAFAEALRVGGKPALAALELGRVAELRGDREGALRNYRTAAALAPEEGHPWLRLGLLLERQGRYGEAREALTRAEALLRGEAKQEAAAARARVVLKSQVALALPAFRRGERTASGRITWLLLADVAAERGVPAQAVIWYSRAFRSSPPRGEVVLRAAAAAVEAAAAAGPRAREGFYRQALLWLETELERLAARPRGAPERARLRRLWRAEPALLRLLTSPPTLPPHLEERLRRVATRLGAAELNKGT